MYLAAQRIDETYIYYILHTTDRNMTYLQNVNKNETGLKEGQKYTLFYIDEMMALTHRVELTTVKVDEIESYAQYSNVLRLVFVQRRKRNPGSMLLKESMIFLNGWDLPLKIDTDFNSYSGNALLNFVGEPQEIRKILELNAYNHTRKGIIAYSLPGESEYYDTKILDKKMLYPEIAAEEAHAVVQRIMSK